MEVLETENFSKWLVKLKDTQARARILVRIDRLLLGNPGDVAPVGDGVSEMRIHYGPGYRVYFVQRGDTLVVLLAGGDKSTQGSDIKTALALAKEIQKTGA
ncbi:MAG: type II toxin-antitoxin system RelE/ParE family toxin [Alphaproteobacteria bacterium]|nr:type II toxin-antitoxin system RelE/ParE family toxin [Alphaproteobacteria bacterium]